VTGSAGVGTAAAVLLAATFVVAGGSKLREPARTATAFRGLRLPRPGLLARAIPLVELATATLLVARPAIGGAAALGALAAFSAVLARSLRAGDRVTCGCFGSSGAGEVGPLHLVRNALLACLAATALMASRPEIPDLAAVVLVTTAVATALIGLGLVRMGQDLGAVWATILPGEPTP
jgi:hypothetical protein